MPNGYSIHIGVSDTNTSQIAAPSLPHADLSAVTFTEVFSNLPGWSEARLLTSNSSLTTKNHITSSASTYNNFVNAVVDIASKANPSDLVVITFSGHGRQVTSIGWLEPDGEDETWVLQDREVIDDEIIETLKAFRPGVRIVVIADCCNSDDVVSRLLSLSGANRLRQIQSIAGLGAPNQSIPIFTDRVGRARNEIALIGLLPTGPTGQDGIFSLTTRPARLQKPKPRTSIIEIGATAAHQSLPIPPAGHLTAFAESVISAVNSRFFYRNYYDFYLSVVKMTRKQAGNQAILDPVYRTNSIRDFDFESSAPFVIGRSTTLAILTNTANRPGMASFTNLTISKSPNHTLYPFPPNLTITAPQSGSTVIPNNGVISLVTTTSNFTLGLNQGTGTPPCRSNCGGIGGAQHIFIMVGNEQFMQVNNNSWNVPVDDLEDGTYTIRAVLGTQCDEIPQSSATAYLAHSFNLNSATPNAKLYDPTISTLFLSSPRDIGIPSGVHYDTTGVLLDFRTSHSTNRKVRATLSDGTTSISEDLDPDGPYCITGLDQSPSGPKYYTLNLRVIDTTVVAPNDPYVRHVVTDGNDEVDLNDITIEIVIPI